MTPLGAELGVRTGDVGLIGGFNSGLVVVLLLVNMQYADKKGHWGSMCGLSYAGYLCLTSMLTI